MSAEYCRVFSDMLRNCVVRQEMDRLYQLWRTDQISADGFGQRHRPLEERFKQLDDEIPHLQAEVDLLKISYHSSDEILAEARDLYQRWANLAMGERRQIVEQVVQRIVVDKDGVEIELCYLPSPAEVGLRGLSTKNSPLVNGQQNSIPALPFCHLQLHAAKPLPRAYPQVVATLGYHLCRRRLELSLLQCELATVIGVTELTVTNWELNHTEPELRYVPQILAFPGTDPRPAGHHTARAMVRCRPTALVPIGSESHREGSAI